MLITLNQKKLYSAIATLVLKLNFSFLWQFQLWFSKRNHKNLNWSHHKRW